MTKEQPSITAQLKNFDSQSVSWKTTQKNMYDPVKTPSISSIYSYNHLPPLLFSFIFHPSLSNNSLSLTSP